MAFGGGPLTAFTLIAAPAVLTNAAAVLAMSTSNRFSRTLDRARFLSGQLTATDLQPAQRELRISQFERAQVRSFVLLKALSAFYLSLASLAFTSLISIAGAIFTAIAPVRYASLGAWLAVGVGSVGVATLAYGCVYLVRETRLAMYSIVEEADHLRKNFPLHTELPDQFD